ncbi:NUDIX hydrolase [Nocardioidaceae bacterium]|nr:NUDIX hydrolase [Nocardioidaceae bacterium]
MPLPAHLARQARDVADGRATPAEPRNAATVVLVRDGRDAEPGGLDVYFLRRTIDMAFAGGMAVFPGGGVDTRDFAASDALTEAEHDEVVRRWAGPDLAQWSARLGTDEDLARALVLAAVRETFEESGVLLAGAREDDVVADTTGEEWEADRAALEAHELSMSELLARRDLVLRTDLLAPWSCWVTPVFEPRRYRTWFFLATLPAGQVTRDVSTESVEVRWSTVADAMQAADDRELLMMPPQYYTLTELYDAPTAAAAAELASRREWHQVEPAARFEGDEAHLEVPSRLVELAAQVAERRTARGRS